MNRARLLVDAVVVAVLATLLSLAGARTMREAQAQQDPEFYASYMQVSRDADVGGDLVVDGCVSVPAWRGMISHFPGGCPCNWDEYTEARGRMIVGVPTNGTLEGTSGDALANLELRRGGTARGGSIASPSISGGSYALSGSAPTVTSGSLTISGGSYSLTGSAPTVTGGTYSLTGSAPTISGGSYSLTGGNHRHTGGNHTHAYTDITAGSGSGNSFASGSGGTVVAGSRTNTTAGYTSAPNTGSASVSLSGSAPTISGGSYSLTGSAPSITGGSYTLTGSPPSVSGGNVSISGGSYSLSGSPPSITGGGGTWGVPNEDPPAPYIQLRACRYNPS